MAARDFEFLEHLASTDFCFQRDSVCMTEQPPNLIAPIGDVCNFDAFSEPNMCLHHLLDLRCDKTALADFVLLAENQRVNIR